MGVIKVLALQEVVGVKSRGCKDDNPGPREGGAVRTFVLEGTKWMKFFGEYKTF